jgi:hypothetical protein
VCETTDVGAIHESVVVGVANSIEHDDVDVAVGCSV